MRSQSVRIAAILTIMTLMIPIVQSGALEAAEPSPADLRGTAAAYGPGGDLWAVWSEVTGDSSDLFYSRRSADGWSPVGTVYRNATTWDEAPSLAFDAEGVAWVAWSSSTGAGDTLYVSHWTGRRWSLPHQVPAADTVPNRQPVLAAAPDGGLWLAWVGFDGNDDEIYAAFWDGLSWSDPQRVSGDDIDPAAYDGQPQIAVGREGAVWVAWTSYEQFLDDEIFAARWDGQRWLPEQRVSADRDAVAASPTLVVGDDGGAWIAWHSTPDVAGDVGRRIHVRAWSPADGWGQEEVVSSPAGSYVEETDPCLALDDADRLHVTWRVAGGASGLGYRAFDSQGWSEPRLDARLAATDLVCLPGAAAPTLLWWPTVEPAVLPQSAELAATALPRLPQIAVPHESRDATLQLVINRHLAFGDSITAGLYIDPATGQPVGDYPARLSAKLNGRVVPSEVINDGLPGEKVYAGRFRLLDVSWPTYTPQFLELMEGTNDITHSDTYNDIAYNLDEMVKWPKRAGTRVFLSTLIPREDNRYDETQTMNGYIADVAAKRGVPLVDNWQAFQNSGNWHALMADFLHPNDAGMQVLADSWYASILSNISWLTEDTVPPQTWIESLPATSECTAVQVQWNGTDNIGEVVDYDVQVQKNGTVWTDWLVATPDKSGTYGAGSLGDSLGFRVRGRDLVGNQSEYSAPQYTMLVDSAPPYDVGMASLPAVQKAPFTLTWWGYDACSDVTFDVQCSAGSPANWQAWLTNVTYTSATFDPETASCGPAQYGVPYYFRAVARDEAGRTTTSSSVSTVIAQYTVD
ncbi:MAG: GDSL-type esterase/lipase family protein, partial [Anaerolineae bacterium]